MSEERRKLRVLVITMGSERQQHIENLFEHPNMSKHFETPVFSPGVSSRSLRNRVEFFRIANEVGILPPKEWEALQKADPTNKHTEEFFDCLKSVPITQGRRGSKRDVALHYSTELWYKAKTINRGRSVLGCAFAHLIALRTLVSEGFDLILEDNVRAPVESCAERLWGSIKASEEWTKQGNGDCHIRFFGWLGSIPNLKWILQTHAKKKCFTRTTDPSNQQGNNPTQAISIFTFPLAEDLEADWEEIQGDFEDVDNGEKDSVQQAGGTENAETEADNYYANEKRVHTKPGGNFVWGAYAYWMTREAYETIIQTLRNDVGALLWKGKRARYYSVKPIDKILPRQVISSFGANSVHLSTHPAFFRAPMLTSKIHTQWDPEFCKSSEFQMQQSGLDWSDLWLSYTEMEIVKHRRSSGEWLTIAKFKMLGQKEREEQNKFL